MSQVRVEYIGAEERYNEFAITGVPQIWIRGQQGFVAAAQVSAFLATGLFKLDGYEPAFVQETAGGGKQLVDKGGQVVGDGASAQANTVVLLGDSMPSQNNRTFFGTSRITSLTRTSNVATLTINVAHELWTGRRIRIRGETVDGFNGDHVVTRVDANTVTFPCPGPDATAARSNTMVMDLGRRTGVGYFLWLQMALRGRLNLIANEGVNAQTTAQILARVPDVIALRPARCIVLGGYNDLLQGFTPQQTLENLTEIARQLSAAWIVCDLMTPIPIGSGAATFNTANVQHLLTVRRGLLALGASNTIPGLLVHDVHDALVDRNETTNVGMARAGMLSDNIHPGPRAAKAMGEVLAAGMSATLAPWNRLPASYAEVTLTGAGGYNVIKAGPYVASGGTTSSPVTGTTALNVRTQRGSGSTGTCVASVITAPDGSLRQRIVITPGGVESWTILSNDGAAVAALVTPGEKRRLVADVKISGITAGAPFDYMNLRVIYTVDGVSFTHFATVDVSGGAVNTDIEGTIISEPVEVPSGTITSVVWRFDVFASGAGSEITAEIGRVGYLLES